MAADPEQVVRDFCAAWERRDLTAILAALHPGVVYQNVPRPAMRGQEARAFLVPVVERAAAIDFILKAIATAADGRTVLTERLDRLHYPAGMVEIPLMGVFEVEDGLIIAWRDYPDSAHVQRQVAALASG